MGCVWSRKTTFRDHDTRLHPVWPLSWGLGRGQSHAPKTVLRTGFGIFYDRFGKDVHPDAEESERQQPDSSLHS